MKRAKYLYLTRAEWAEAWIAGGRVPVNLASSYLSAERRGTRTPDETVIHESPVDLRGLQPFIVLKGRFKNVDVSDNYANGVRLPEIRNTSVAMYEEDGLILSFCDAEDAAIARRLGKQACVRIEDMGALKRELDAQIGLTSIMAQCKYTHDHQRGHFLKSIEDRWQREFRLFWKASGPREVLIPKGTATLKAVYGTGKKKGRSRPEGRQGGEAPRDE